MVERLSELTDVVCPFSLSERSLGAALTAGGGGSSGGTIDASVGSGG